MAPKTAIVWAAEDTEEVPHARYRAEPVAEVRTRLHALWWLRLGEGPTATAAAARDWIEEQFGAVYTMGSMYTLLPRLGIRLKMARPCHTQADPQAQAAWKSSAVGRPVYQPLMVAESTDVEPGVAVGAKKLGSKR